MAFFGHHHELMKAIERMLDYVYSVQIVPKRKEVIVWCHSDYLDKLKEDAGKYLKNIKIPKRGAIFIAYLTF